MVYLPGNENVCSINSELKKCRSQPSEDEIAEFLIIFSSI